MGHRKRSCVPVPHRNGEEVLFCYLDVFINDYIILYRTSYKERTVRAFLRKFKARTKEWVHKRKEKDLPTIDLSELGIGAMVRVPSIVLECQKREDTQAKIEPLSDRHADNLRWIGGL